MGQLFKGRICSEQIPPFLRVDFIEKAFGKFSLIQPLTHFNPSELLDLDTIKIKSVS